MSDWHRRDIADVLRTLRTDRESGLSSVGAADRLREEGPNELPGGPALSPWRVLLSRFASTMVAVLLGDIALLSAGCPVAIVGQNRLPG